MTGAERTRRYRARNRERLEQEAAASRERARLRDLPENAACDCCGERRRVFLATATRCWNCAHAERVLGICPHQGHGILG